MRFAGKNRIIFWRRLPPPPKIRPGRTGAIKIELLAPLANCIISSWDSNKFDTSLLRIKPEDESGVPNYFY